MRRRGRLQLRRSAQSLPARIHLRPRRLRASGRDLRSASAGLRERKVLRSVRPRLPRRLPPELRRRHALRAGRRVRRGRLRAGRDRARRQRTLADAARLPHPGSAAIHRAGDVQGPEAFGPDAARAAHHPGPAGLAAGDRQRVRRPPAAAVPARMGPAADPRLRRPRHHPGEPAQRRSDAAHPRSGRRTPESSGGLDQPRLLLAASVRGRDRRRPRRSARMRPHRRGHQRLRDRRDRPMQRRGPAVDPAAAVGLQRDGGEARLRLGPERRPAAGEAGDGQGPAHPHRSAHVRSERRRIPLHRGGDRVRSGQRMHRRLRWPGPRRGERHRRNRRRGHRPGALRPRSPGSGRTRRRSARSRLADHGRYARLQRQRDHLRHRG